ncbi:hypothetical protein DL770_004080 [Monosporascus sp. CRB-9-2]|nr:hypothetical protein DL770_004080 [Monosporascus sp. CRB-9-2]
MSSSSSRNNNLRRNGPRQNLSLNGESPRAAASSSSSAEVLEFKVQPTPTVTQNRRPPYAIIVGLTPPRRDSNCFVQLFLYGPSGEPVGEVRDGSASERVLQDAGVGCYIFPNVKLSAPVDGWHYLRASLQVATADGATEMHSIASQWFILAPEEPHDPDELDFYQRVANAGLLR